MSERHVVCGTSDIKEGEASGFVLMVKGDGGEPAPWPILITRKNGRIYGFENTCPHQRQRLDLSRARFSTRKANSSRAASTMPSSIWTRANAPWDPAKGRA